MVSEDQEIGHIVGVGNPGAPQVMRESGAFVKAPVNDHPLAEAAVEESADAVFRDGFHFHFSLRGSELIELCEGVVEIAGDINAVQAIFADAFLVLLFVLRFIVRRAALRRRAEGQQKGEEP